MGLPISCWAAMWVQWCRMWFWSVFMATKLNCWLTGKMKWKVSGYYTHIAALHAYIVPSTMACVMNFFKALPWSLSTFAASLFSGKALCYITKSLRVFPQIQFLLPNSLESSHYSFLKTGIPNILFVSSLYREIDFHFKMKLFFLGSNSCIWFENQSWSCT